MKTSFFKRLMMSLTVIVLGIGTAFTTTSMSSTKALSNVQGYRFVSQADPCHVDIMCSTIQSATICTSGSNQLWGKVTPNAVTCPLTLYKIPN